MAACRSACPPEKREQAPVGALYCPGPVPITGDRALIGDTEGQLLRTRAPGYQLQLGRDDLDSPPPTEPGPMQLPADKTTLAIHAAHRMRAQYPDGVLYIDLLGANPQSLAPADVLARFLRDLGRPGSWPRPYSACSAGVATGPAV